MSRTRILKNPRLWAYLVLQYVKLAWASLCDVGKYARHAMFGFRSLRPDPAHIEAQIIKLCHALEKGLGMAELRPRFGAEKIRHLGVLFGQWLQIGGASDNPHLLSAFACLASYRRLHAEIGVAVDDLFCPELLVRLGAGPGHPGGGVERVAARDYFSSADAGFDRFAASRRSWRVFRAGAIPDRSRLEAALATALRAPSVCNRQAWRVHAFTERGVIDSLLSQQNGNAGFGHTIPCLLAVTVDLRCFDGVIERYQPWIEGGVFGMMLLLALHHQRLAAVPLNWCAGPAQHRMFHRRSGIPSHELVVMLIGMGEPAPEAALPVSQRRTVPEILTVHQSQPHRSGSEGAEAAGAAGAVRPLRPN